MTGDEMAGWRHRLNRHELEQTLGDGEGQGSVVCCSPRGGKESDITERLSNNRVLSAGVLGSVYEPASLILTTTGTQSSEK